MDAGGRLTHRSLYARHSREVTRDFRLFIVKLQLAVQHIHTQRTKICQAQHLDMSRCWALALWCGKFVVQQVVACPLVVFPSDLGRGR